MAADRYLVAARLSHSGTEFGEPRLLIDDGQQASIERTGEGGFSLIVTPVALANGRIRLVTILRSPYGSMSPTVTTGFGQAATISNGEVEMEFVVSRAGS